MIIDIENINTFGKETKCIQLYGGKYTKLQKKVISKNLIFFQIIVFKCKDNVNEAINIPIEVKNNIKRMATEQKIYVQVVKISRNYLISLQQIRIKMNLNSSSKVNLQYHSVGLIFTLIGIKSILSHVNLISIRIFFRAMRIHKILIHVNYFKFQQEIQNVRENSSFTMMPQCSSIVRIH